MQQVFKNHVHGATFRWYVNLFTAVMRGMHHRDPSPEEIRILWTYADREYGFKPRPFPTNWDRDVTEGGEQLSSSFGQSQPKAPPETPASQLLPDSEDQVEKDPKQTVVAATTTTTPTTGQPAPTALDNPVVFTGNQPTPTMATSTAALKKKGKARERDPAGVKSGIIDTRTPAERQREAQSWRRGQIFTAARKNQDTAGDHTMGVGKEALAQQLTKNAAQQKKDQWTAAPTRSPPAWMITPHVGEQRWPQASAYHFKGVGENETGRLLPRRGDKYNTPTYRRDFGPDPFGPANRTQYIDTRGADGDGRDDSLPWKRKPNEGAYTGAPRPSYPRMFRPFGSNTRQRVVGDRSGITHMHHTGYAKGIVESVPSQPLLPSHSTLGQSGAAAVNHGIAALRAGPSHYLFTHR